LSSTLQSARGRACSPDAGHTTTAVRLAPRRSSLHRRWVAAAYGTSRAGASYCELFGGGEVRNYRIEFAADPGRLWSSNSHRIARRDIQPNNVIRFLRTI